MRSLLLSEHDGMHRAVYPGDHTFRRPWQRAQLVDSGFGKEI